MRKGYLVIAAILLILMAGCKARNIHSDPCITDACITAQTGDINPADPLEDENRYIWDERE